jgi:hypothetical protein
MARFVFLLLLGAIFVSSVSGSSWFSSSDSEADDKAAKKEVPPQVNLVSPIVNRELEASVIAHSWPTTPQSVFCEALAYHSQDGDPAGVAFLDRLVPITKTAAAATTTISYQNATDMVLQASPLSASAKRLFQYALHMRASSPQCELHRGLARESLQQAGLFMSSAVIAMDVFAVVQGKVMPQEVLLSLDWSSFMATTEHAGDEAIVGDESLLLPDEVPIGGSDKNDGALVIIYANLGSVAFAHIYQTLVQAKVRFVVRHLGAVHYEEDPTTAIATALQGYGVRLDIRNVEYKVFDDRSDNKAGGSEDNGMLDLTNTTELSAPPQYLAGVNLTALGLENQAPLVASLWRAHDGQQAQSQILPPVWQRRQLPLQAAAVIAASKDPLVTLQEVSQDLPSVASTLAYVKIPEEIEKMAKGLEDNKLFKPGRLYINGRGTSMTSASFNVFLLMDLLREEQAALDEMQSLLGRYLEPGALRAVQSAWMMGDEFLNNAAASDELAEAADMSTSDNTFRVDVARGGKQAVMYLNNVEKDRQYAQWPKSLQQMMMGMQYGMPPAVRRNLFTVLAVVDPISSASNVGFDFGLQLMDKSFPVRIGVLVVDQDDVKSCVKWLSNNTVDEGTACPVSPLFGSKPTKESLKKIPATAQAIHRLYSAFATEYGEDTGAGLAYLEYYLASLEQHKETKGEVYMSDLITLHGTLLAAMRITDSSEAEEEALAALSEDSKDSDTYVYGRAVRFAADKAISPGMSFLNGKPLPTDDEDSVSAFFAEEQKHVFGLIMKKKITDNSPKSVYAKLLSGKRVFKKCHPLLIGGQDNVDSYLQLDHNFGVESLIFPDPKSTPLDAKFVVEALIEYDTREGVKILASLLPVLDSFLFSLDSESGSEAAHFGYRILPSTASAAKSPICPILSYASLLGSSSVKAAIDKFSIAADTSTSEDILNSLPDVSSEVRERILSGATDGPCSSSKYLDWELPAKNFILGNGRLFAVDEESTVGQEDIELLMTMELERAKAVAALLKELVASDPSTAFDAISRATSFLAVSGADSSLDRLTLDQPILDLEKELEIDENPLRFTWDTESDQIDGGEGIKVRDS